MLTQITNAGSLEELNARLTQAMAEKRALPLLRDDGLQSVLSAIRVLALGEGARSELLAASMMGRLAAVARGRESQIHEEIPTLLSRAPESIETLADGDAKTYAAQMLRFAEEDWLLDYCAREALMLDTAENARRELLTITLDSCRDISTWFLKLCEHAGVLREIESIESRMKRVRRISEAMRDILQTWNEGAGSDPGVALCQFAEDFLGGRIADAELATIADVADNVLAMLARIIQLRFSLAMMARTYPVVAELKKRFGLARWGEFLNRSQAVSGVRIALLEAALVLARQNRMDSDIMGVLKAAFGSPGALTSAVRNHFEYAVDLDPQVASWWIKAGEVSGRTRKVEHAVGSTEDEQIGALLIVVEDNHVLMERVGRAVVPFLSVSDEVLALTLESATKGYEQMAQIARRLARMRKLTRTEILGQRVEFNPMEHELIGDRSGVRHVKVVRDGIKKEFGGRIRTLVKPRVEPAR